MADLSSRCANRRVWRARDRGSAPALPEKIGFRERNSTTVLQIKEPPQEAAAHCDFLGCRYPHGLRLLLGGRNNCVSVMVLSGINDCDDGAAADPHFSRLHPLLSKWFQPLSARSNRLSF